MNEINTDNTPVSLEEFETLSRLLQPGLTLVDVAAALVAHGLTGSAVEAYTVADRELDDLKAVLVENPESEAEQLYKGRTRRRGFAALRVIAAAIGRPLPEPDPLPQSATSSKNVF